MSTLASSPLNNEADSVNWVLEKLGRYSTKSMYRWMAHRGVFNKRMKRIWSSKLPMKLKIFLWLVYNKKLQTGMKLKKRKWKGSHLCGVVGGQRQ